MRPKTKVWIPLLLIILLSWQGCWQVFTIRPNQRSAEERLAQFPQENLPLEKPANIYWNEYMVPFIEAEDDGDCAFLLGMVHAHLRWGQMELLRRISQGRLAESVGPLAIPLDHSIRVFQLDRAVPEIEAQLPDDTRKWLQDFVRGLNYYIESQDELPLEMKALGIMPERWTVSDILRQGRLMSADVNWFNWFLTVQYGEKPYWPKLWQRLVERGFSSVPTFGPGAYGVAQVLSAGIKSGSNAYAVAGHKSADSSAILASDPHLGLTLPNMWVLAAYRCPSYHVTGMMFPGIPAVLVGRNPDIAWAGTNMRSASSDLYDITDNDSIEITTEMERIPVKNWFDKRIVKRVSELGPIISDAPLLKAGKGRDLAMKWVGYEPSDEISSFLRLNRARNWQEFRQAFEGYAVSGQNFVYADDGGNIGMVLALALPERQPQYFPNATLDLENPYIFWENVIPSTQLPSVYNPENGILASANNRPVETDPPIGYFFSANDRITRISELLLSRERINIADIRRFQEDVGVPSVLAAKEGFLRRMQEFGFAEVAEPYYVEIQSILAEWQGEFTARAKAPVIYELMLYHFATYYYSMMYDQDAAELLMGSEYIHQFVEEDLEKGDPAPVKRALAHALKKTAREQHRFENWGEMHRLVVAHPFANIPLIGRRYGFGDFPASGTYNSPMKTAHDITNKRHASFYGANSRFIARMIDPDENYFVLLGGQDGWVASQNFVDQVGLWLEGQYMKIPLRIETAKALFPYPMKLK